MKHDSSALPNYGADADWGDETDQACRIFQADFDLIESAVLDVGTVFAVTPFQVSGSVGDGGYQELQSQVDDIDSELTAVESELENLLSTLRGV